jgi:hypothetical protein
MLVENSVLRCLREAASLNAKGARAIARILKLLGSVRVRVRAGERRSDGHLRLPRGVPLRGRLLLVVANDDMLRVEVFGPSATNLPIAALVELPQMPATFDGHPLEPAFLEHKKALFDEILKGLGVPTKVITGATVYSSGDLVADLIDSFVDKAAAENAAAKIIDRICADAGLSKINIGPPLSTLSQAYFTLLALGCRRCRRCSWFCEATKTLTICRRSARRLISKALVDGSDVEHLVIVDCVPARPFHTSPAYATMFGWQLTFEPLWPGKTLNHQGTKGTKE